jgi:hypothetical protein
MIFLAPFAMVPTRHEVTYEPLDRWVRLCVYRRWHIVRLWLQDDVTTINYLNIDWHPTPFLCARPSDFRAA